MSVPAALLFLAIDAESAMLTAAAAPGDTAAQRVAWPLGWRRLGQQAFGDAPVADAGIERAIALIEDAIMPSAGIVPRDARLALVPGGWHALAGLVGADRGAPRALTPDDIERTFDDWLAQMRAPGRFMRHASDDRLLAVQMLVLREVVHHLRVAAVLVPATASVTAGRG